MLRAAGDVEIEACAVEQPCRVISSHRLCVVMVLGGGQDVRQQLPPPRPIARGAEDVFSEVSAQES
jgi:hypothetical protein